MSRKTETFDIQGKTFSLTQLPFTTSRKALLRMGKLLAPLMLAKGGAKAGEDAMNEALRGVCELLTDADLDFFTAAFGSNSEYVQGDRARRLDREEVQEEVFAGSGVGLYFAWLKQCFVFNFADFFGETLGKKST